MGEWAVTRQVVLVRDETAGGALVGIRQLDVRSGDVDRRSGGRIRTCDLICSCFHSKVMGTTHKKIHGVRQVFR